MLGRVHLGGLALVVLLFSLPSLGRAGPVDSETSAEAEKETEDGAIDSITIEATLPSEAKEFSIGIESDYEHVDGTTFAHLPAVVFNLGLTDFLDVEVEFPFLFTSAGKTAFGLGDLTGNFKWLVIKETARFPAIVIGAAAEFPTGNVDRELGAGEFVLKPFISGLKMFGPVVLQGNIGWSRVLTSREEERCGILVGGISLAVPVVRRRLYVLAELSGSKVVNRQETIVAAAPGLRWVWPKGNSVGVAMPLPICGHGSGIGMITQFEAIF